MAALGYSFLMQNSAAFFSELESEGFDGLGAGGDFAILKLEIDPKFSGQIAKFRSNNLDVSHLACLPLRAKPLQMGDMLWSLTFPSFTRKDLSSSYEPVLTQGKVASSFASSGKPYVMTTVDAEEGSSGGVVMDHDGKIAGVIFGARGNPKTPLSKVIPIQTILTSLEASSEVDGMRGKDFVAHILNSCEVSPKTLAQIAEIVRLTARENKKPR